MNASLLIPKKCKVGFNPRNDTYSGKLGYVIAHDGKKWRKEDSWLGWIYNVKNDSYVQTETQNQYNQRKSYLVQEYDRMLKSKEHWCQKTVSEYTLERYLETYLGSINTFRPNIGRVTSDSSFEPFEFDNVPLEGFVLNKKAGGYSTGWNHRSTYCRVYDPRGFEIEITIPNLLYILQECNAYKGKGLEGEFVYSWDGKDLVLLPVSSPEYVDSLKFTQLQGEKVSSKELIVGATYLSKQKKNYVFLGRYDYLSYNWGGKNVNILKNAYIMYNLTTSKVEVMTSLTSIAKLVNADMHVNFADFLSKFSESNNAYNVSDFEETFVSIGKLDWSDKVGKSFGTSLVKLDENEYEIYDMILQEREYDRLYNYTVKKFEIISKKKLLINPDKTITIKPLKTPKVESNLTPRNFKDYKLLQLTAIMKNNNKYTIIF